MKLPDLFPEGTCCDFAALLSCHLPFKRQFHKMIKHTQTIRW